MKVLFAAVPQGGHLYPILPLAKAFAAQGDDVVIATGPDALHIADRSLPGTSGVQLVGVGGGFGAWWQALASRTRGVPGDGLPIGRIVPYFAPRLFAEVGAADMVDDLLEIGREFNPDIVVFDSMCFAGPLVAQELDALPVQHMFGPAIDAASLEMCSDALSPLWRSFGHHVPPYGGLYSGVTLDICPRTIGAGHPTPSADIRPLRPTDLPKAETEMIPSLRGLDDRPLIYVTLGTFSNGDSSIFHAAVNALADEPVNVVVTVGATNDPDDLGRPPDNVRVERFIPQAQVLPRCAAVVHHAGCGTMFGALAHGLPALVIPQGADNFRNAELLAKSGAGLRLLPDQVSAKAVRSGVVQLLDDDRYRVSAAAIAAEIARMPSPDDVVTGLLASV